MRINIGELMTRRALITPQREGLVCEGIRRTYRELNERANRFANAMLGLGVASLGTALGLYLWNDGVFVEWESERAGISDRASDLGVDEGLMDEQVERLEAMEDELEAIQTIDAVSWALLAVGVAATALWAALFFAAWVLYMGGRLAPGVKLRDREIMHAFRKAGLWQYSVIVLLRTPALLSAVVVYTFALRLFGVEAAFLDMLGYLPVIFFGAATPGPMRSVAIVLWVTLFPEHEGEMTTFGFVQHNFFIFFNAAIGLLFLRRANRELFGRQSEA